MNPIRIALDKATGSATLLRRATLCAVIAALAGIALLALAGWFLTAAAMAGAAGTVAVQAFNYLVPSAAIRLLAILRTVSRYGERLWSHRAALEAMGGLRASLFARIAAQDSRTALPLSSGDAAARLTGDIDALEDLVVRRPSRIAGLMAALAGVMLAASGGWLSALLLAVMLAALPLLLRILARRLTEGPAQQAADALGALRARYVELASARAEIAAYGLGDRVMAELAPLTRRLDRARARLFIGEGVQAALLAAYSALAVMLVLLGADAPASLVALALLASAGAVEAMAGLSRTAFRQASVDAGLARLAALDALPLDDMPTPSAATAQAIRLGTVELRPGARVAVTGRSGSGKSLLAEGLAGLRPVTADVTLGGHPLVTCSGTELRDQFALSPQDAPMLAGSIADNLRLARPGIDAADMADALHVACLDQRIASLPGGIDYRLGEAGGTLSGGERKRLSLARALLTGRPWLLLDEPTEGLDAATEALLISRLRIWLDRTGTGLILISHRPAPLTLTDRQVPVSAIAPLPGQGLPGVASAA
ncbi:ATP-binding cassette domain-containing protein [Sphingobium yanoikuyae]|uniref:ATP-binding cassette domain-containing protein n=1 Tax=Sphingobium yanoikuyae TaxID=13690 RepID=A0A085K081_SPHYA|nr:ATP-binding cassette domain-containing protein [Sphingobium yanoikuyae]AYO77888.1 ATP-binding cassette domain-containing protein [Sphingobium yanoikuyae]KFD26127.1 ABC transporter [Sphingobium yanoikuyae]KZC75278.1 ABC transporter [Sphingobium yanoikuyae]MDV3479230.1 ATP-binding cassette domain-containing protein [Sphingobium yanoikuyae]